MNRSLDDAGEIRQRGREAEGPAQYMLYRPTTGVRSFTADPRITTQGLPVSRCDMDLVDVDSEMLGITRKLGSCSLSKYQPNRDGSVASACRLPPSTNLTNDLDAEDCRSSNPPCTLRCTGWNRWEFLCNNPQDHALSRINRPVNYRAVSKDNHRALVEMPLVDCTPPTPRQEKARPSVPDEVRDAATSYPPLPVTRHWRDAGEIDRIMHGNRRPRKLACSNER